MHIFKINGTQTTYPTSITYNLEDLHTEDSGRSTLTGIMIMDLLRQNVRNYTLNWHFLSSAEAGKIMRLLKSSKFIQVYIHDALNDEDATYTYYTGGISTQSMSFASGKIFYSLSVSLIQK